MSCSFDSAHPTEYDGPSPADSHQTEDRTPEPSNEDDCWSNEIPDSRKDPEGWRESDGTGTDSSGNTLYSEASSNQQAVSEMGRQIATVLEGITNENAIPEGSVSGKLDKIYGPISLTVQGAGPVAFPLQLPQLDSLRKRARRMESGRARKCVRRPWMIPADKITVRSGWTRTMDELKHTVMRKFGRDVEHGDTTTIALLGALVVEEGTHLEPQTLTGTSSGHFANVIVRLPAVASGGGFYFRDRASAYHGWYDTDREGSVAYQAFFDDCREWWIDRVTSGCVMFLVYELCCPGASAESMRVDDSSKVKTLNELADAWVDTRWDEVQQYMLMPLQYGLETTDDLGKPFKEILKGCDSGIWDVLKRVDNLEVFIVNVYYESVWSSRQGCRVRWMPRPYAPKRGPHNAEFYVHEHAYRSDGMGIIPRDFFEAPRDHIIGTCVFKGPAMHRPDDIHNEHHTRMARQLCRWGSECDKCSPFCTDLSREVECWPHFVLAARCTLVESLLERSLNCAAVRVLLENWFRDETEYDLGSLVESLEADSDLFMRSLPTLPIAVEDVKPKEVTMEDLAKLVEVALIWCSPTSFRFLWLICTPGIASHHHNSQVKAILQSISHFGTYDKDGDPHYTGQLALDDHFTRLTPLVRNWFADGIWTLGGVLKEVITGNNKRAGGFLAQLIVDPLYRCPESLTFSAIMNTHKHPDDALAFVHYLHDMSGLDALPMIRLRSPNKVDTLYSAFDILCNTRLFDGLPSNIQEQYGSAVDYAWGRIGPTICDLVLNPLCTAKRLIGFFHSVRRKFIYNSRPVPPLHELAEFLPALKWAIHFGIMRHHNPEYHIDRRDALKALERVLRGFYSHFCEGGTDGPLKALGGLLRTLDVSQWPDDTKAMMATVLLKFASDEECADDMMGWFGAHLLNQLGLDAVERSASQLPQSCCHSPHALLVRVRVGAQLSSVSEALASLKILCNNSLLNPNDATWAHHVISAGMAKSLRRKVRLWDAECTQEPACCTKSRVVLQDFLEELCRCHKDAGAACQRKTRGSLRARPAVEVPELVITSTRTKRARTSAA